MTIPAWLQRHLEATGKVGSDGVGRTARARRCPRCRSVILAGLDADRCAFAVRVDPFTLDAATELAAILTGRHTFRVRPRGDGVQLDARSQWDLRGSPPGDDVLVVAAHRCDAPLSITPLPDPHPTCVEETTCPF